MKKIITIVLLLAVTFTFAQVTLSPDYDYKVSEPYKVVDARSKEYFSNGKSVLSLKVKPKKNQILLQKYDVQNMKEIGKKYYNDLPKNFVYEGLVEAQGKYYFFYSSWTGRKTKHERLFVREIDFKSGTFKGEAKKIIDHDGKLAEFFDTNSGMSFFGGYGNIGLVPKFDFLVSDDGSKILIQYRKKPTVRKDTKSWDIIAVNVYDMDLNKIWSKTYTMPYTERRMNFIDNLIDNDGNTFMLTKIFHDDSNKDKKKRKDKKANYHIELFELNNTTDKIKTSKINLDDNFINGISMYQSTNKEILCAGFYNKGKILSNSDGLFTYKINQNGELTDKKYYEIPLEILNQYERKKVKKKNKKKNKKGKAEAYSLELKNVIYHDDNSLTLIGEKDYIESHTYFTKNGTRTTISYHYDDILISKISADGALTWMKKIPKRQIGRKGKGGMSYSYFNANGNHYLIYLDNVKNIELPFDKKPAIHSDGKGGYLTAVKIDDQTGAIEKGSILDFKRIKRKIKAYQFNTDRIVKIKENEFFVEVYKKKKEDVFLKIEMKKIIQ